MTIVNFIVACILIMLIQVIAIVIISLAVYGLCKWDDMHDPRRDEQ